MTNSNTFPFLVAGVCLGLTAPTFAMQLHAVDTTQFQNRALHAVGDTPATKCVGDLHSFHNQIMKDGYWLQLPGTGGYGYPLFGSRSGARAILFRSASDNATTAQTEHLRLRSGDAVRTLLVAANILAQQGQQQACETLLTSTRSIYKFYIAGLHDGGATKADVPGWRHQQLISAEPVIGSHFVFQADELVGTDVLDPQSNSLGSIDDVVSDPKTGKIAYLMIKQGGVFGTDENYIPIPWGDFKSTDGAYLMVLNTTKASMDSAPKLKKDQFYTIHDFKERSQMVDDYWAAHLQK